MTLRRFLGWEPREVTEYELDEHGRVVRSVTVREAEWDDEQRAWAVALLDLEADTCDGCGQSLSETTTSEAFEGYEVDDPAACQGCKALLTKQRQEEYATSPNLPAFRFGVRRTWTPHTEE